MQKIQELGQKIIDELNQDKDKQTEQASVAQANVIRLEGAAQGVVLFFNRMNKMIEEEAKANEKPAE